MLCQNFQKRDRFFFLLPTDGKQSLGPVCWHLLQCIFLGPTIVVEAPALDHECEKARFESHSHSFQSFVRCIYQGNLCCYSNRVSFAEVLKKILLVRIVKQSSISFVFQSFQFRTLSYYLTNIGKVLLPDVFMWTLANILVFLFFVANLIHLLIVNNLC